MFEHEFRLAEDICYLNHAAVAPWPQRTVEAVRRFADENGRAGSQRYERWLDTERQLREQLRQLINAASTEEIALLKNTSEGLSVVAYGMQWFVGDQIVISDQEFPSNRIVWESLTALGVEVIEVDLMGAESPEQALVAAFTARTRLLSISSVQYASGLVLDLQALGAQCRRHGVTFCVDAIQSIGARPLDVQACQADFVVADGHKWMLGPEGVALFYCRRRWISRLALRQFGWHMVEVPGDYERREWQPAASARRFECGSPNMLGIHALHASLGLLLEIGIDQVYQCISSNVEYLIVLLDENNASILSSREPERRAGIVTFKMPGLSSEALFRHLQATGVICALRGGGIRFSPHFYTPHAVMERAVRLAVQASER
jgi:selenocysteine lyase/cysteine desulfurase